MRKILIALTALMSLSAFASGEKILKYIPEGTYSGSDCQVSVKAYSSQGKKSVSVTVEGRGDLAIFNSSLNGNMYQESAKPNKYSAAVEVIPNDQYTGVRRYFVEISKNVYQAKVKVVEKRKFLGFWTTERSASCDITI